MDKIKILELFGGIGACSKALERLGIDYEIVDYVEIDKYAVKSFNAMHGTNFEPQDICEWDKDIDVDLVMHGSPCQDFSLAGLQAGGDEGSGTRSSLMYETVRIVEKLKPKYVIWENVKNVISKKHIHNFNNYIDRLNELGYTSYYQVLNAKDYGIPQNRERVFTISIRNDLNQEFTFPPKQELKLRLKDMLQDNVEEKYYLSEQAILGRQATHYQKYKLEENIVNDKEIHPTILARFEGAPTLYVDENNLPGAYGRDYGSKGKIQDKDYCDTLTASMRTGGGNIPILKEDGYVANKYSEFVEEKGYIPEMFNPYNKSEINDIAPTQTSQCGSTTSSATVLVNDVYSNSEKQLFTEDGNIKRYINSDIVDEFKEGQMATTSFPNGYGHGPRTHNESISLNTIDKPSVKHNLRIRKLIPLETWLLMGFDKSDFEKASKVCSNSQLYKQAGNSIVVNVLESILKELLCKKN